ncbi:hypothetical protein GCM10010869_11390 [Mesorhizobium tianshanense]|nr:hypothetical protein GCM10010869_11390 [Mesorhizobium tianshanense]
MRVVSSESTLCTSNAGAKGSSEVAARNTPPRRGVSSAARTFGNPANITVPPAAPTKVRLVNVMPPPVA